MLSGIGCSSSRIFDDICVSMLFWCQVHLELFRHLDTGTLKLLSNLIVAMGDEEVAALVVDNGSGMCKAGPRRR